MKAYARKLALRLTHRIWYGVIARTLAKAYADGVLSLQQLQTLAPQFDPDREHDLY